MRAVFDFGTAVFDCATMIEAGFDVRARAAGRPRIRRDGNAVHERLLLAFGSQIPAAVLP